MFGFDIQLEVAVIGLLNSITVAIIGGFFARDSKKKKIAIDKAEQRATLRAEESRLAMRMMSSSISLGIATAVALKEGRVNGEVTGAVEEAKKVRGEYFGFIDRIAVQQITKT